MPCVTESASPSFCSTNKIVININAILYNCLYFIPECHQQPTQSLRVAQYGVNIRAYCSVTQSLWNKRLFFFFFLKCLKKEQICIPPTFLVIRSLIAASVEFLSFHSQIIFYSILDLSILVFKISWKKKHSSVVVKWCHSKRSGL